MKKRKGLKDWEIFEEDVADYLGGKRQPGSGAPIMCKGDVKCEDFLVECKQTSKEVYTLNIKTWEKICEEARNQFRIPLFACRSKAGDFFVMNQIDYDEDGEADLYTYEFVEVDDKKNLKIDKDFITKFKGKTCDYHLVCFEVDLEDYYD